MPQVYLDSTSHLCDLDSLTFGHLQIGIYNQVRLSASELAMHTVPAESPAPSKSACKLRSAFFRQ